MDEPTTYGPGPFTGIAHRIAWQHQEIERLRERCEAYKGQVEAGAVEIERLRRRAENAEDTIKNMEQAAKLLNIHKHGEK